MTESLTNAVHNAVQTAYLLIEDVREAHTKACHATRSQVLEIALLDLLTQARELADKLNRVQIAALSDKAAP